MHQEVREQLDKLLNIYSQDPYFDNLVAAKKTYFKDSGIPQEEEDDYESRMRKFTDWYLFEYSSPEGDLPPVKRFFENQEEEEANEEMRKTLLESNHSLFEYNGESFRGFPLLKDYLHDKKIHLSKEFPIKSLLKGDIFLGRTFLYLGETYLTDALTVLPKEAKSILKKEARKVRKSKRPENEESFLFLTESLRVKFRRYNHVTIDKIFIYPKLSS